MHFGFFGSLMYFTVVLIFAATAVAAILTARRHNCCDSFRVAMNYLLLAVFFFLVNDALDFLGHAGGLSPYTELVVSTDVMSLMMVGGFFCLFLAAASLITYAKRKR